MPVEESAYLRTTLDEANVSVYSFKLNEFVLDFLSKRFFAVLLYFHLSFTFGSIL